MPAKDKAPSPPEWKTLVCVTQFGRFVPGDEIDIPREAIFDTAYFAVKDDAE